MTIKRVTLFDMLEFLEETLKQNTDFVMNCEQRKQNAFTNITSFLKYQEPIDIALLELKKLIYKHGNINNEEIRNWTINYKNLYNKNLLDFDVHYLDHELTQGNNIFVCEVNTITDATPFRALIIFCKAQSILIGKRYDLSLQEEKHLIKDYYYSGEKDLTADLKAIKNYLNC